MSINTGDTLKIWFVDFWGGFEFDDNYFYYLLDAAYNVELDKENPDVLFFSADPWRKIERDLFKDTDAKKVFYTIESVPPLFDASTYPPPFTIRTKKNGKLISCSEGAGYRDYFYSQCDFALTHTVTDDPRHFRFPYWSYQIDWFNKQDYGPVETDFLLPENQITNNQYISTTKTKFCSHVFHNEWQNPRLEMHEKLSEYKQVDGFGSHFDEHINGYGAKYNLYKDYKFVICFENAIREGYHTEKLFHAKTAGAVPIYWGHSSVSNDFNPESFINLNDFESVDALVERIKEIDQDDLLYQQYVDAPLFTGGVVAYKFKPAAVLDFFQNTILA